MHIPVLCHRLHLRLAINLRAGSQCRIGQTEGVIQRMNITTTRVQKATDIGLTPHQLRNFSGIEALHDRAMRLPLPGFLLQIPEARGIMSSPQPAHRARITLNLMLGDQIKHQFSRIPRHLNHALAHLWAKFCNCVFRVFNQTWINLPAVAPRGSPTRGVRLQHHNPLTQFRQIQSRREASETSSNDGHIRLNRRSKFRAVWGWVGGGRP